MLDFEFVKFEVFIPEEYVEHLRKSISEIGAAKIGNYDNCTSYYTVNGTWRPLEGSKPFEGTINRVEHSKEIKVEFRARKDLIENVIKEIKRIHPYEEPVYNVVPILNK